MQLIIINNGKHFDCDPLSPATINRCKITLKQCFRMEGIMSIALTIMIVQDTKKISISTKRACNIGYLLNQDGKDAAIIQNLA